MDSTADLFATSMLSVHDTITQQHQRTAPDEESLHAHYEEDDDSKTETGASNEHIAAPLLPTTTNDATEKPTKKKDRPILRPPSSILKSASFATPGQVTEMKSMKDIALDEDLNPSNVPRPYTPQTPFQSFVATNLGILYMVLSAFSFCFVSLSVKAIAMGEEKVPTTQVVFVRSLLSLISCELLRIHWGHGGGFVGWKIEGVRWLVIDGVCAFLSMLGVTFIARPPFIFGHMFKSETPPEALAPDTVELIDSILSANTTDPNNIVADIIPPSDNSGSRFMGVMVALVGAVLGASTTILVRKLGSSKATALHITGFFSLISIPLAIAFNFISAMSTRASSPTSTEWIIPQDPLTYLHLLIIAFAALAGQLSMNKALQLERAGRASSVNYVQVVFAFLAEWVVWGTKPHIMSVIGSVLVASCVVLIAVAKMRAKK
ncbi:hypothetical protein HDV00_007473 [Rhizophlyctis rosea]|nr:hypothetical protein HDV00_007473 [Rhizophlyctis rosea]